MYSSDIDGVRKKAVRCAFIYLLISVFCAVFGAVYELFSHEVYSYYMIYAFSFPLVGGTLPYLILTLKRSPRYPRATAGRLYHAGIAALTVGSILRGVLDIYGTTNRLMIIYLIAGAGMVIAGVVIYIVQGCSRRQKNEKNMEGDRT